MRTISNSGFAAVEAEFRARRNASLVRRLRTETKAVPQTTTDAEVIARIEPVIKDAKSLGFAEREDDLFRFVALAFVPEAVRRDRFFATALQRCLGNERVHPTDRLDFAYRHILPKARVPT